MNWLTLSTCKPVPCSMSVWIYCNLHLFTVSRKQVRWSVFPSLRIFHRFLLSTAKGLHSQWSRSRCLDVMASVRLKQTTHWAAVTSLSIGGLLGNLEILYFGEPWVGLITVSCRNSSWPHELSLQLFPKRSYLLPGQVSWERKLRDTHGEASLYNSTSLTDTLIIFFLDNTGQFLGSECKGRTIFYRGVQHNSQGTAEIIGMHLRCV